MKHIEVEWVDANILHGWQTGQSSIEDCDLAVSKESGYLIHEDEDKIIITRGYSAYGLYNSPMAIPRGCIKSIRELRVR